MDAPSARTEALEDLRAVRRGSRHQADGPVIGASALARLCGLPAENDGWEDVPEHERAELIRDGWFSASGDLGPRGSELRRGLGGHHTILALRARDTNGLRRGWVIVGDELAVTVLEEGIANAADAPQGQVAFEVGPANSLPIVLAKWGGLDPTWNYDTAHELKDASLVQRRVSDASTGAPEGADQKLLELWGRDWTLWSITGPEAGVNLEFIAIGEQGHYIVRTRTDGATVLAPRPGSLVWGDLQLISTMLPGQPERSDDGEDW